MSERLHCDYCDKLIRENETRFELLINEISIETEIIPEICISIDLCSDECLKATLNLGSKLLKYAWIPDGERLAKCFKEREIENE